MNELNFMHENIYGIYNYCDRWCEKCSYTHRCLLFKQEAEMEIKHILKDDDKNDSDVLAKDIVDSFQEVFEQVNQFMAEEDEEYEEFEKDNFDFDDEEDNDFEYSFFNEEIDNERPSTFLKNADNPLILLSEKLFKDYNKYYDLIKLKFPFELDEKNSENLLWQNLEVLSWYIPLIHVKTRMCYWYKNKLSKSKDQEFAEVDEEMLNVSARIAFVGIEKCINALNNHPKLILELQAETISLLEKMNQIKEMFVAEFPAALTYKRPYFD